MKRAALIVGALTVGFVVGLAAMPLWESTKDWRRQKFYRRGRA